MKKNVVSGILAALVVVIVSAAIWWNSPTYFLKRTTPEDISKIEVFNGNNGDSFEVIDSEDISFIVEHIQQVPMKKEKIAMGMGTTYNLRFYDESGEEKEFFIINSKNSIRDGVMFYQCDGELETTEQYLIHLEGEHFPDSEWVKENMNH